MLSSPCRYPFQPAHLLASLLAFPLAFLLAGCGPPVTIKYHQIGACNRFQNGGQVETFDQNYALVIYEIESIDNTKTGTDFNFAPTRMYNDNPTQPVPAHVRTNLGFATDLGIPLLQPLLVPHGTIVSTNGLAVAAVYTNALDGAVEANQTAYPLSYLLGQGDPDVAMQNTTPSRTSWPPTEDCRDIPYQ